MLKIQRILFWTDADVDVNAEADAATYRLALQGHVGAWSGPGAERGDVCAEPINGLKGQSGGDGDIPWKWCWLID